MTFSLFAIAWNEMLLPTAPWIEKIIRPILVYGVLLVLFRVISKREMAQATLFDFLVILLISNVVQNAMIGADNSILGGAMGAAVLVAMSTWLNHATAHSKRARVLLEGKPVLLMRDGVIQEDVMKKKSISHNDLLSAIRKQGIGRLREVGFAILELDGSISVLKREDESAGRLDCLPEEVVGSNSAEVNCPFHRN